MKQLILTLIAMLTVTVASAQSLYVKKYEGKAYYRVVNKKGKESFYRLSADTPPTEKKLSGMDYNYTITRNKYEEIPVSEEPTTYASKKDSRQERPSASTVSSGVSAFEYVVPAPSSSSITVTPINGTPLTSSSNLYTGSAYKLFTVTQAQDLSLVGQPVVCQVLDRRKSNIFGSEGRLSLLPLYVETPSGPRSLQPVPVMRRGLNRTNVKFWTGIFIIPLFIPGTGAKILPGETFTLTLQ